MPEELVSGSPSAKPVVRQRLHRALIAWTALDQHIAPAERRNTVSQRAAVALALAHKLLVVTGGPGVGETTLVNSILKILCEKSQVSPRISSRPIR
jgi:ATP-dependent exoDNAse (exonuclease V) alpha subunit